MIRHMLRAASLLISLVTLAALLAGCMDSGNVSTGTAASSADPPGPDLGALDVLVTTPELEPVAQAVVELVGSERRAFTDEAGRARFDGLEPAAYTVVAAKPGYKAMQPTGRLVQVIAGQAIEVKLGLEQIGVVSAENAYHRTLIFRGFISCSIERATVQPVFNRTQCGNGVDVAGNRLGRDPNDNFSHPWQVETAHVESIVLEAKWSPSFGAVGEQLYIAAMDAFTCSAQSCNYANEIGGKGGRSPLYHAIHEGSAGQITAKLERSGDKGYPQPAWTVLRTHCPAPCTLAVTMQQSYEAYTSVFYGLPAAPGWSTFTQ